MRAAFDLLPDAVFCVDRRSMTFVEVNRAACSRLGYTIEELLNLGPRHICPEEDVAALQKRFDAIPAEEPAAVVVRTRHRRKDGQAVPVEWHVSRVRQTGVEQWIVVARELLSEGVADRLAGNTPAESQGLGVLGHDPLTGLPDRRLFERRLDRALQRSGKHEEYKFAVCFIDLDNFKAINDRAGHLIGDRVLCEVARRLVGCVRPSDMVARFGGDEFMVLVDDLHGDADAAYVGRRILGCLREPMILDGQPVEVAASIGVATSSRRHRRIEDLLHDADRAMYRVKALGGGDLAI